MYRKRVDSGDSRRRLPCRAPVSKQQKGFNDPASQFVAFANADKKMTFDQQFGEPVTSY